MVDLTAWRARLDDVRRRRPWVDVAVATVERFRSDEASRLAALIAYYGFFSLFPLLLVFVTLASWLLAGNPQWQERLIDSALSQFPVIGDQLEESLGEIGGSGITLVVGFALALWSGLGATQAIQDALAVIWRTPKERRRGFVRSRLRSLAVLATIGAGVVVTAALTAVAGHLTAFPLVAQLVAIATSFAVALGIFVVTFRVLGPGSVPVGDVVPGSALAAVGWVVLQVFGVVLVDRQLRHASALYGVFGLVIGLLSWLYLLAQVSTIGAELNATVRDRRLAPAGSAEASVRHAGAQVDERLAEDA